MSHAFLGLARHRGAYRRYARSSPSCSPHAEFAGYTGFQDGVLGFSKALAAELGKEGVRVNAMGPGFIATAAERQRTRDNSELVKTFIDHTPLGAPGTAR